MPDNIPLEDWSGSGATKRLHEAITEFNKATAKQTTQLIRLTRVLVILTVALVVGLGVQIWVDWT